MSFRRPPSDVDRMTSLRVDNLPYSAVMEDLQPLFERFGDVGDIYLPKERDSGRSRGFAFVRFFDKHDAEDALDELNGRSYDGRDLRIRMDEGRPRRDDGGGRGYGGGRGGGDRGGDRRDERRGSDDRDRRGGGRRRSRSRSRSASRSRSRSRGDRRSRSPKRASRRSPSPKRSRSPKERKESASPPPRREERRSRSRS